MLQRSRSTNNSSRQDVPENFVSHLRSLAENKPDDAMYVFLTDGEASEVRVSFSELDQRARAIAQQLLASNMRGERALLLFPPGLDFVASLFGCFYAGVVAVPAYPPRRNRNANRIHAIAQDAKAKVAITVSDLAKRIERFVGDAPPLQNLEWITADTVDSQSADGWSPPQIDKSTLAVLQYTSGSTGSPKGVMLSHGNLIANCEWITEAFGTRQKEIGMSWLPMYHDMGLIGGILNPLFMNGAKSENSCPSIVMSPTAFLQKPARWLQAISRYKVTISGGPNFAYDYCTKKITEEEMEQLDLDSWRVAFNGAEPVRASTIQNFSRRFARCGFRPESFYPCYGMAESTLMITGGDREQRPVSRCFDGPCLDDREVISVEPIDPNARQLVGCGQPPAGSSVKIVDPETRRQCPEGRIGEIWVSGPSVGQGYYNKDQITEETFRARPAGMPKNAEEHPYYLRTGDLGFFHRGQLFVTGRLKDLIIVRGVNRYPQDIELTVEQSDERLRTGAAAAFAIELHGRERLILVSEVERIAENNWDEVIGAIRRNVTATHEIAPDGIVLIRAGSIPKTSSGKIQRHACRAGFLDDSLMVIADWFNWTSNSKNHRAAGQDSADSGNQTNKHVTSLGLVFHAVRHVAKERVDHELSGETNVVELGLDSLERLEIANYLENHCGALFPTEVLTNIETCDEIARAVEEHLMFGSSDHNQVGAIPTSAHRFDQFPEYAHLQRTKSALIQNGIENPYFTVHEGVTRDTTVIAGQEMINFSSYNYIGMSGEPFVTEAAKSALEMFGTSCSASRLVSGEKPVHRQLETAIANFLRVDDAITLVGGHATNETTIGHLCGSGDLILHDALAHNSILQGAVLSGARRRAFAHNDFQELDVILSELRGQYRRVLIVIEGAYSMDGDYPDLANFVAVKKRHQALLMVDEAHSIGTMGATGRGIGEHAAINPRDVDIWMGTLSKSFGSCGGYIAGPSALIELLKYTAPGFVYSVGLPPSNAAAALAALTLLKKQPERATRCRENAAHFLRLAKEAGFDTGNSHGTPVVPIITGNSRMALQLSQNLYADGINVQPILYPAVEESAARLRFFITSEHTSDQIEKTVASLRTARKNALSRNGSSQTRTHEPASSEAEHNHLATVHVNGDHRAVRPNS